jgi:hypothetical protein
MVWYNVDQDQIENDKGNPMGAIAKAVGSLFGGVDAPKTNTAPADTMIDEEAAKNKRARTALIESAAGTAGAQLQPGQVGGSGNLFGN